MNPYGPLGRTVQGMMSPGSSGFGPGPSGFAPGSSAFGPTSKIHYYKVHMYNIH